jgi:S-(hydroxymethyl)glutathione dehydrogenase/alcohol dehydrogenase
MGTSTFAEYAVIPEIALAKVSPEAPLDGCAPFACGLSTGIGAALNTAQVEEGSTVVVFGCGLVGLGAVIGSRLAGAGRIVALDLSPSVRERATGAIMSASPETTASRIRPRPAGSRTTRSRRPARSPMRQAVEAAREAWALIHVRCRQRRGVGRRPASSDHRAEMTGRHSEASGRTQALFVDWWLAGEIDVSR